MGIALTEAPSHCLPGVTGGGHAPPLEQACPHAKEDGQAGKRMQPPAAALRIRRAAAAGRSRRPAPMGRA
ncbi:MAG: hypothetical protein MZU91_12655 [Desulfosudis oleivorans]|nr:hypothetical protein [Desulfosudis oleivorans]